MKRLLALLAVLLIQGQAVQADDYSPGVVKFRAQLEHMRLEVLRSNFMMIKLGDGNLTKADIDFISSHTTEEDAAAVGNGSQTLLQALQVAIVKLGGSVELTDKEKRSINNSLTEQSALSDQVFEPTI